METTKYRRHVACKTTIRNITAGTFVQEAEEHNYLLTETSEKLYRVNIIATIVQKEKAGTITTFLLDDGTSTLTARSFEENKHFDALTVGSIVLAVGKVRVYNEEKYLSPEIIKKLDPLWLKLRSLELQKTMPTQQTTQVTEPPKETAEEPSQQTPKPTPSVEIIQEPAENIPPFEKIAKLIETLDEGEGVLIETVIAESTVPDTEKMLEKMLEKGDIFQNQPGKVKVL